MFKVIDKSMDVSGRSAEAILREVRNIFLAGNDANLQVRGNIYNVLRVAHHFKKQGHAVEWRYESYTNVWICHRRSRTVVNITSLYQIEQCQQMVLRHRILELELTAQGELPVNYMWTIVLWACERDYIMTSECLERGMRVLLRKPHDALPEMEID